MNIPVFCALAIALAPKVWVVDMSTLPRDPKFQYMFTLEILPPGGKSGELSCVAGKNSDPQVFVDWLTTMLSGQRDKWDFEERGFEVRIYGVGGNHVPSIVSKGTGPKPTIRWEFAGPRKVGGKKPK